MDLQFLEDNLKNYYDCDLIQLLRYGFPLGVDPTCEIESTLKNHPSAHQYFQYIDSFIEKELKLNGLTGPFTISPFEEPFISPLMTVAKKPTGRRICIDATFGENSVNNATPESVYLGEITDYNYPKVDEYEELIRKHGEGCLLWKRDLRRFFLQLPVDPLDYDKLCFVWRGFLFLFVVAMFGLRNSGYAGQRTTSAVVFIFKKSYKDKNGKPFDCLNYSDDFGGVARSVDAWVSFYAMGALLTRIGLEESVDKAFPPSTFMPYLGVQFDTIKMEKTVTPERMQELRTALDHFIVKEVATKSELQSITHRLLWVSTCVTNSRIFVSRLSSEI